MSVSTVPAARAELLSRWVTLPDLAGVQLSDGTPSVPEAEFIALGAVDAEQSWAALGTSSREERYDCEVLISVAYRNEDDHAGAQERAFALMSAIEADLRVDNELVTGLQAFVSELSSYRFEPRGPDDAGVRQAALTFQITALARI